MGFGFNLFFIFVLIPLTIILLIAWLVTRKNPNSKNATTKASYF